MATADRILQLKLLSDSTQVSKDMKGVQQSMTKTQRVTARATTGMRSGFAKLGAAVAGLAVADFFVDTIKTAIDDMFEAEKAAKALDRSLTSLGMNTARNMQLIESATNNALSLNFDDTEFVKSLTGLIDRTHD